MDVKKAIKDAPSTPGVYIFKGKKGRVLYVGKAVNLRARLTSYTRPGWKEEMIKEAVSLSWQELRSDIEALIRESELIKKFRPYYNIFWRDDKNYLYVAITKEQFPRIFFTHQVIKDQKVEYIGPFTEALPVKRVLSLLRRIFPYCTCSSKTKHKRRCVNAEIGKCLGYCCADIPATPAQIKKYRSHISAIKKILSGKVTSLARQLEKNMRSYASTQRYEQARQARDQLAGLARIFEHSPFLKGEISEERMKALRVLQLLLELPSSPERIEGYDISHHQGSSTVASMVVFKEGLPDKSQYRKFIIRTVEGIDDFASMKEVLSRRLSHADWEKPDVILIDGGRGQLNSALAAKPDDIDIPFISIAKREEELYIPGRKDPLELKKLPAPLLHLLTHIRDESHRFAVSFHRKRKRAKDLPNI